MVLIGVDEIEQAGRAQVMTRKEPVSAHEKGHANQSEDLIYWLLCTSIIPIFVCNEFVDASNLEGCVADEESDKADLEGVWEKLERTLLDTDGEDYQIGDQEH